MATTHARTEKLDGKFAFRGCQCGRGRLRSPRVTVAGHREADTPGNGGIRMKSTLRDLPAAAFLIVIAGFPAGALAICTDQAAVCAARAKAEAMCNCATA